MTFLKTLLIGLLTCSIAAHGEPGNQSWYATIEAGQSNLEYEASDVYGFVRLDDDNTAWGISVGYHVQPWLAVEAGYFDHGSFSGDGFYCPPQAVCLAAIFPTSGDLDSVSLNIVPVWYFNERLSLVGKLGVSRWDLSTTITAPETSGTEFQYGGGVRVHLTGQLDLQVGFESAGDRESFLAGLRWSF